MASHTPEMLALSAELCQFWFNGTARFDAGPTIGKDLIMNGFVWAIRILAVAFIAVSCLHLFMGLYADAAVGSPITAEMAAQPSFDSQNRFYGVTFSMLGVALLIGSTDLVRYKPIILAALGVLFAAGIARAISWMLFGAPSTIIIGILVADLLLPPILYVWMKKSMGAAA
jgi:hypothetical protein